MELDTSVVAEIVRRVIEAGGGTAQASDMVPVGVSNRHIHLTKEHVEILFGKGYELTKHKDLSQPGQYACKELLTIIGPSLRPIENVRVVTIDEGVIIANRHIHMSPADAAAFGVKDGDTVIVEADGERRTRFYDVQIRVSEAFRLEMHVDTDDANAAGIGNGAKVRVVRE